MIYTITFNPSLDYIVTLPNLTLGSINRTKEEVIYPGGKGINVSIVLSYLGIENKILGFVAGFTGAEIEKRLHELGCSTHFIYLNEGMSRINVKIKSELESEINAQGPDIPMNALNQLYKVIDELRDDDQLILAGSIPSALPRDVYECVIKHVKSKNIQIIVDAEKELLIRSLKYHPFLIKPNLKELEELFDIQIRSKNEIVSYANKLQSMGARNVLVSMAADGAVLVTEEGGVYTSMAPKGVVVNSVGAGDSMVAGFLAGYNKSLNYEEAFYLGLAAGSASAFTNWLPKEEEILKLMQSVIRVNKEIIN